MSIPPGCPRSCLPTLLTLSTAKGFPIKQIAPRNPSCSRWTGTLRLRGEPHLLLTRGLDNMVSVKVSSGNIVNMRHSADECVHCPGGRAAGGGDDGDHGAGHHAHQGGPELQTRETGSAAQTVTRHEKLLRRLYITISLHRLQSICLTLLKNILESDYGKALSFQKILLLGLGFKLRLQKYNLLKCRV